MFWTGLHGQNHYSSSIFASPVLAHLYQQRYAVCWCETTTRIGSALGMCLLSLSRIIYRDVLIPYVPTNVRKRWFPTYQAAMGYEILETSWLYLRRCIGCLVVRFLQTLNPVEIIKGFHGHEWLFIDLCVCAYPILHGVRHVHLTAIALIDIGWLGKLHTIATHSTLSQTTGWHECNESKYLLPVPARRRRLTLALHEERAWAFWSCHVCFVWCHLKVRWDRRLKIVIVMETLPRMAWAKWCKLFQRSPHDTSKFFHMIPPKPVLCCEICCQIKFRLPNMIITTSDEPVIVCMYVCMYAYACVCVCMYVCIYIYIYIHTFV